jgi:type IV fimbrial biogenesis protein FimT
MTTGTHPRDVSGFTLLELMTTILVGSVLLAIAVPSFKQMTASNRLTTQANEFVAALNLSRSEAIKRNTGVTLCRVGNNTTTTCANTAVRAAWQYWIVRTNAGTVISRNTVNVYSNTLAVKSTLPGDLAVFGSDGLTRTNGNALVSGQNITVCASNVTTNRLRTITLGAGSRLATQPSSGACP